MTNEFYLTKNRFSSLSKGDIFSYQPEEMGDKRCDDNNKSERETSWSRWRTDLASWKSKEY